MYVARRLAAIFGSALVLIACSMGLASQASAASLTISSPQFLGFIHPGIPSGAADELSYVNALIDLAPVSGSVFSGQILLRSANVLCFASCPDATLVGSVKDESQSATGSFGSGFTYLLGKYDADQGGALVWYVAGLTGTFDIPAAFGWCGGPGCEISHWVLYNPITVPEPATLLLLGSSLVGIVYAQRKRWLELKS